MIRLFEEHTNDRPSFHPDQEHGKSFEYLVLQG